MGATSACGRVDSVEQLAKITFTVSDGLYMTNIAPAVQMLTISAAHAGQRIDNFMLSKLKGVPKSAIYRILRKGEVRVNKKRIKPEYKLQFGDIVRIPPLRVAAGRNVDISQKLDKVSALTQTVIYEDETIIALNKPAGMAVHGGSNIQFGVIEALRALRPEAHFLELVHRLDRDTSGILLIAKKRSALRALHDQLRHKKMHKRYLALVKGRWPRQLSVVNVPLKKETHSSGGFQVRATPDGKVCETHFSIQERFTFATLITARPITGRTHQIRLHTCLSGYPIACDPRYGDKAFDMQLAATGLKRLFLHAAALTFNHPVTQCTLTLEAPLDANLSGCLTQLRVAQLTHPPVASKAD